MAQLNAEDIVSRNIDGLLPDEELIHPRDKDAAFAGICDLL